MNSNELHKTIDANVWAEAFLEVLETKGIKIDLEFFDFVRGWFANAIMAGFDHGVASSNKITPKNISELEQNTAFLADHYSGLWSRIYNNLLLSGIEADKALYMLCIFINTSCANTMRKDDNHDK